MLLSMEILNPNRECTMHTTMSNVPLRHVLCWYGIREYVHPYIASKSQIASKGKADKEAMAQAVPTA